MPVSRLSRRSLLAGLPGVALGAGDAAAQRVELTFGTAAEGGGFVVYAEAFVDAVRWANPSIKIKSVATKGTVENIPLLEAGKIDIGLAAGEMVHRLFHRSDGPRTGIRVICAVYSAPGMFVVRADTRLRSITDLKGRRVVWNGRDSAIALQGRDVVEGLGLDPEKDFIPVYTDSMNDGSKMVLDGQASALWGSGNRWPPFAKVASDQRGARFVVPDAGEIERILAAHGFMRRFTVTAGHYPAQREPIVTVGSWNYLLARPFLDDAIGYWLAAGLHRVEGATMQPFSNLLAETTAKNTLAALPRPGALQGGVELYFREVGLLR
ncbi:MAG: TAXI family TRAP transporter solute-binding subunit [Reyranellaceae bacterium]